MSHSNRPVDGEVLIALSRRPGVPAQKKGLLTRARLKAIAALGWAMTDEARGPRGARLWHATQAGLAHIATIRAPIRKEALRRERAARGVVLALVAPDRLPEPNHEVAINLTAAAKERKKAAVAANRYTRKECLLAAQRYDKAAHEARSKQIEEHWSKMADTETTALATRRGDDLALVDTHVPAWLRDEYGALVPGDDGLPQLRFESAKARRRTHGIDHVMKGGRMQEKQYLAAQTYGQVCADAAQALMGAREETGAPPSCAAKPSPGPADWKLEAMAKKKLADYRLRIALGELEGVAMTKLLEAICYEGLTPRQHAGGDQLNGIRAEERMLIGLNILGARGDFVLVKVGEH